MRRLLVVAFLLLAPDLLAQQGPPKDPAATCTADLVELVKARAFLQRPAEWWQYNYQDWREYPILDIPFSVIGK